MKAFLIVILIGAAIYFGYQHLNNDELAAPDVIDNPVYADVRVDARVGGRDLQLVLFGKMASQEDCELRSALVWTKFLSGCKECIKRTSVCKAQLEPRYQRLFDNVAIPSAYVSATRGSKYERDGRIVIFGLTADEGDAICEQTIANFKSSYAGTIECVKARRN